MADLLRVENLFSVAGTTVLVTGGGSGIGKTLTKAFAINGARVIIVGRRQHVLDATAREIGGDIICVKGDVSTKDGAEDVIQQVKKAVTVLDTVINCAGISIPFKRPSDNLDDPDTAADLLSQVDDADWTETHKVNVNGMGAQFKACVQPLTPADPSGPYFMTVSAIPLLRKSDNPNVVIISSVAGLVNQRANGSFTYGVSKAGAVHLSSMLAGRLHPLKIRVNCICPGIFPSEMTATTGADGAVALGRMGTKAVMRSTLGRPGKPEEIAAPILLLASKGGMYMNDTCINVDGGRWLVMKGIYDGLRLPDESYIN
ncbi:hypothetical protein EHS25_002240 [Saitozyma podzolica]|uniref:Uncharacterized protein n=1 Tax=Saitozyma podzolica TaxID=1890683 RepID=A0A427YET4_9TREE|nr:hypothetical protein EHS25_002240 [Saitozyma podzolica]